jgi:hypothetical protein
VVADFGKQGLAELTDYLPEIRWCVVIARRDVVPVSVIVVIASWKLE